MKYTSELVWEAVFMVCPHYKVMRENKMHTNLPEALKSAAVEYFLISSGFQSHPYSTKLDFTNCEYIVAAALDELRGNGYMCFEEFGKCDETI